MREARTVHDVLLAAIADELRGSELTARALGTPSDEGWRRLLAAADWHRLTSAVGGAVAGLAVTPAWVVERIQAGRVHELARQLMVDDTRVRVLDALAGARIPALLLKGSALVERVYPATVLRDMSDIDVLVPKDRLVAATAAVRGAGFAPMEALEPSGDSAARRHDRKLVDRQALVPVELHRHVLDNADAPAFAVDELWAAALPSERGAHLLPAPHDLLIHVALHFLSGRVVRSEGALSQLRDVAWIVACDGIDPEAFVRATERRGVSERVRVALGTTVELGLAGGLAEQLATADRPAVRRFARARVLVDDAEPPVGSWTPDAVGLRQGLWWSRVHLGDVPAGDLPDEPVRRRTGTAGRAVGLRRLLIALARDPRRLVLDLRVGRWLRRLARADLRC